ERILLGEIGVAAFGGRHGAAVVIKLGGAVFLVGQNLLHVAEFLFGGLREFGIRELSDHRAAFVFGALTFGVVTIRLHHLLHVDIANLRLRLGGLFHARVEEDEILVFDFGLGEPVRVAFTEPAIGDRELGFRQIFAGVVGVDQRVQRDAGRQILALFDILNCLVVQHLIGLERVFGDGRFVLLLVKEAEAAKQVHGDGEAGHRQQRIAK